MENRLIVAAILLVLGAAAVYTSPLSSSSGKKHLLGTKECTFGPSYWCANITNAKSCNAVRHCIQTVWVHQTVPEDNDSICQICLDMVKQARDQLESNETQEELKEVFEGSCKLIPLKPVKKECIRLADDFVPELIETLASQMNPQVVCSVAGLCNNARIDQMLEEQGMSTNGRVDDGFSCDDCNNVAGKISSKFHAADRDDVLENMLHVCGKFSSFSDACASILLTYFNDIYAEISKSLNTESLCHLTGVCSAKFHQHPELVEIRPMSQVGVVRTDARDDIPCELCEQLVNHLKDLLIANTTEDEFKQVLSGLCKQTGKFADECLSIVDQYYAEIYNSLVKNLDANEACFYIGVCPKGTAAQLPPIVPLVPYHIEKPVFKKKLLGEDEPKLSADEIDRAQLPIERVISPKPPRKFLLGANEPKLTNVEIQNAQLPIDRLMGPKNQFALVESGKWCTMCEYTMHFIQEALSNQKNEDEIKSAFEKACDTIRPDAFSRECKNFVESYGDAIIALLVQEVDPTNICPMLKICPSKMSDDIEIFAPVEVEIHVSTSNKPSCPLCLLAVKQAQDVIKNDKTKEKVKQVLEGLCSHLNQKLKGECDDFVETYSKELIDLLINDFTAEQICVYLKLCTDKPIQTNIYGISDERNDILTNEIPDNTVEGRFVGTYTDTEYQATPECLLCIEVIKEVEKKVINKHSKEQIKHALDHACDRLHKVRQKCHEYVEKHGDQIINLIMKEASPKVACRELGFCIRENGGEEDDLLIDDAIQVSVIARPSDSAFQQSGSDSSSEEESKIADHEPLEEGQTCIVCQMIAEKMDVFLKKPKTKDEIRNFLHHICTELPSNMTPKCDKFIKSYTMIIIGLIDSIPPKKLCEDLNVCHAISFESKEEIVECAVCQGTTSALRTLLNEKQVDDEIDSLLEEACHAVPAKYYQRCMNMVDVYGISMIEVIRNYAESHNVCAEIGLCYKSQSSGFVNMEDQGMIEQNVSTKKPYLVGENECTWGPTHWCKDEETATKCGSLDYCQRQQIGHWSA